MKTSSCNTIPRIPAAKPVSGANSWFETAIHWSSKTLGKITLWQGRISQRRQLSELDERSLADIGVSRGDADQESRKPFWQA